MAFCECSSGCSYTQNKWLKLVYLLAKKRCFSSVRHDEYITVCTIFILLLKFVCFLFLFENWLPLPRLSWSCSCSAVSSARNWLLYGFCLKFAFQAKSMALCCCLYWQWKQCRLLVYKYLNWSCRNLHAIVEKKSKCPRAPLKMSIFYYKT